MRAYFDASVLVPLFVDDLFSDSADALVGRSGTIVLVSDFASAAFGSVIARKVRERRLLLDEARSAFAAFDAWTGRVASRVETTSGDIAAAGAFVRRLDLPLRTADAINIAIAQRLAATLATFDVKMGQSAKALGMAVAPG